MKQRDKVFLYVLGGIFCFMILFGIATTILSLLKEPSEAVALRTLGAITSMFSAAVGLILGYLVGRNGNGNGGVRTGRETDH